MERFTVYTGKVHDQAVHYLYDLPNELQANVWIRIGVIPSFTNPFSIAVVKLEDNRLKLVRKEWDKLYDYQRFHLRIYNLDRLRILEDCRELDQQESQQLTEVISVLENELLPSSSQEGYAIDGTVYELEIKSQNCKYQWHTYPAGVFDALFKTLIPAQDLT
jgi:phage-related protein